MRVYIHSKMIYHLFLQKDHVNMPFSISINILISKEAKNEKSLHNKNRKNTRGVHSNFESNQTIRDIKKRSQYIIL